MAKLRWAIPCIVATVDRLTNATTLTHILEDIGVPRAVGEKFDLLSKPLFIQPGFTLASQWERSKPDKAEKIQARLSLVGPNARRLAAVEFSVDLRASPRARNFSRFNHLPFVGYGEYQFQLHTLTGEKWKKVGTARVNVKVADPEPTETRH